jgi:hypothetical protein
MTQKIHNDVLLNLTEDIAKSTYKFFLRRVVKILINNPEYKDLPVSDFLTVTTSSLSVMSANVLLRTASICNDTTKSSDVSVFDLVQLHTKQIKAMIVT